MRSLTKSGEILYKLGMEDISKSHHLGPFLNTFVCEISEKAREALENKHGPLYPTPELAIVRGGRLSSTRKRVDKIRWQKLRYTLLGNIDGKLVVCADSNKDTINGRKTKQAVLDFPNSVVFIAKKYVPQIN